MSLVEAYVKWRVLQYSIRMRWRSRYYMLKRERAERKRPVPAEVLYAGLVEDGT